MSTVYDILITKKETKYLLRSELVIYILVIIKFAFVTYDEKKYAKFDHLKLLSKIELESSECYTFYPAKYLAGFKNSKEYNTF